MISITLDQKVTDDGKDTKKDAQGSQSDDDANERRRKQGTTHHAKGRDFKPKLLKASITDDSFPTKSEDKLLDDKSKGLEMCKIPTPNLKRDEFCFNYIKLQLKDMLSIELNRQYCNINKYDTYG